jgi:hypothetical protein
VFTQCKELARTHSEPVSVIHCMDALLGLGNLLRKWIPFKKSCSARRAAKLRSGTL